MSDFLSNFDDKNYKKRTPKSNNKLNKEEANPTVDVEEDFVQEEIQRNTESGTEKKVILDSKIYETTLTDDEVETDSLDELLEEEEESSSDQHDVEIDPDFKKKKQRKLAMIIGGTIATILIFYGIYYQVTRVKMPNFTDKSIVEVRKWSSENKMKPDYEMTYSLEEDANMVISQSAKPNKKIKKGSDIKFVISDGPDPEELVKLPDFSKMSQGESEQWIKDNKAENVSLITEYSDSVEKGKFIKLDFTNKDVTADSYRRRDTANVYYSKGKEVFEKNIAVPDFKGKAKAEVTEWGTKNGVKIKWIEEDSDTVEEGLVLAQSVEKGKKVAKEETIEVTVSLGKAVIVPNFVEFSAENAATAVEGLQISVKEIYSDSAGYGQLLSQSIEAGTKLTGKKIQDVKVVYSIGQPYLKSYYGQLEGDIPKLIYTDFNSKGASVTYGTYYVDSDQEKGSIVKMSAYNEYIPLDYYISFGISNGRFAGTPTASPNVPNAPQEPGSDTQSMTETMSTE